MLSSTSHNEENLIHHHHGLRYLPPEVENIRKVLLAFVMDECIPAEKEYESHMSRLHGDDRWKPSAVPRCMDRLKYRAKALNLWNLFLPHSLPSHLPRHLNSPTVLNPNLQRTLTHREYGILCGIMGRSTLAPEACNCSAPDTGNMEVLLQHGTPMQQKEYLVPLLNGTTRSAFLMTEPNVASSDAANIETRLTRIEERGSGDVSYLLNGEKWWSTGAMDPRCDFALVLAKMDYSRCGGISKEKISKKGEKRKSGSGRHGAHTVALIPSSAIEPIRPLTVFGYDDAPHGHAHIILRDIHIQPSSLILGEGRGFEIAQSRLGPGRIHHCMRAVGLASRCYELMLVRTMERETFGKKLCEHGGCQEMIADSANDLEAAGLLTLSCAAEVCFYYVH